MPHIHERDGQCYPGCPMYPVPVPWKVMIPFWIICLALFGGWGYLIFT